jgi:hypothetical protein
MRSYFTPRTARWPRQAPESVEVQHYKWVDGLLPYLEKRVTTYRQCGMLWFYESAALVERLQAHGGRVCVECAELACHRAPPWDGRRVAIVASAWDEVVDGVSITMQRVARYLRTRDDTEVIVVAPHTPGKVKKVDTSDIPNLHVGTLPIFRLIGRDEYSVGMPIGKAQEAALLAFQPQVGKKT